MSDLDPDRFTLCQAGAALGALAAIVAAVVLLLPREERPGAVRVWALPGRRRHGDPSRSQDTATLQHSEPGLAVLAGKALAVVRDPSARSQDLHTPTGGNGARALRARA
jgi:hypothetical protein